MQESQNLLNSILKTAQMGQTGIRSTLKSTMRPTLRRALETQLSEYDGIEREAQAIAESRGWELRDLEPVAKGMADMVTRAQRRLHGLPHCRHDDHGQHKGHGEGLTAAAPVQPPGPPGDEPVPKAAGLRKRRHPADAELSLKRKKPPVFQNRGLCHGLWNYLLRFLMENQRAAARTAEVIRTRVVMATSKVSPVAGVTVCLSPQSLHLPSEP